MIREEAEKRIKYLRENIGLTQPQLADKLKISSSAIAMYETDKREPSDDIKLKMCELFNCSMDYLLGKSEYKNEYYTDKIIYDYLIRNEIEVKSITVDNGIEFQALGLTAKKLGVKLYKCDPYCSFQRGTNERTNALVRRFIPKGNSMKSVTQYYLDNISFEINSMPRKLFDYKCSYEIELKYK